MNKTIKIKVMMSMVGLLTLNISAFIVLYNSALETVDVVVANTTLAPRSIIEEKHLKVIAFPKGSLDSSVYIDSKDVVGKVVSYDSTIHPNSMFFKSSIESISDVLDAPILALKDDQRAVSMQVDMIKSSGNTLLPGQYVDVVLTLPIRNKNPLVDVIFEAVRVLAVKDRYGYDMSDSKSQKVPHVALLAIHEQDVSDFYLALEKGSIHLVPLSTNSLLFAEASKKGDSEAWKLLYE